jgi:hypothetical protein
MNKKNNFSLIALALILTGAANAEPQSTFQGWESFLEQSKEGFSCKQYFNSMPEGYKVLCNGEEVTKKIHLIEDFSAVRYVGNGILCGVDNFNPELGEQPFLILEKPKGIEAHDYYTVVIYVTSNSSHTEKLQALRSRIVDFVRAKRSACADAALTS